MKLIRVMGILISLALFVSLAPVAWAAEDSVPGSFTPTNVLPTVNSLEVYESDNSSVASNLAPQTYYFIKVNAGDGNTIDDIDEISVELFFDTTGNDTTTAPGVGDMQTCGILLWDKDGGASEWTIDAGASTTWAILSANCTKPNNMAGATGEWIFVMMLGKVATESVGTDDWDAYAEALDDVGSNELYNYGKEVLWYGEISTSDSADFGDVDNGSGFADDVNEVTDIAVNYISNGDYDQKVKSDVTWAGSSFTADYDSTGTCDDGQEFSLMAYISDTFGSAIQVDTTGVIIDNTGTQTDEAGDDVTTNTLWLKIALVFQNDTYNGNIVYIIADG